MIQTKYDSQTPASTCGTVNEIMDKTRGKNPCKYLILPYLQKTKTEMINVILYAIAKVFFKGFRDNFGRF